MWLALTNPDKHLLPTDPEGIARALEAVNYIVASIHMQGFTRLWLPIHFSPNEADHPAIREKGRQIFEKGLAHFNEQLEGRDYLGGESPSIADAALFYVSFWKVNRMKQNPTSNVGAHYARMCHRPAVARALLIEGLAEDRGQSHLCGGNSTCRSIKRGSTDERILKADNQPSSYLARNGRYGGRSRHAIHRARAGADHHEDGHANH